jgi:hypothetical protein
VSILTPAQLRKHVVTDLPDEALERIIAANDTLIRMYAGEHPPVVLTETYEVWPRRRRIVVERPIDSLQSLVVNGSSVSLTDVRADGRIIHAVKDSVVFYGIVEVAYSPVNDLELRRKVLVSMCLLDVADTGATVAAGQMRIERPNLATEKRKLLYELGYVTVT